MSAQSDPVSSSQTDLAPYQARSVQVGDWRITALSDGFMRLDGGAMWGVVPKALWNKLTPADEQNRIRLALRPFLVEKGDVRLVIEVGVGNRWEAKWKSIYGIEQTISLEDSVRACGLEPEDITHVIASHCHFDHIGAQVVERAGVLAPLFPRARHFAPKCEAEIAMHPDHVRRASYRPDDIVPIQAAGLLETYTGDTELLEGIRVHAAPGHSDGVSVVTINEDQEGDTAIFWADVVPTTHHIQPPYIMAYDIDVVRSFENRSKWLSRAAEAGWLGLFYHDEDFAFARLEADGRRYRAQVLSGEPR